MKMTTNYKGVKIQTVTSGRGVPKSTSVHIIGPNFHKIMRRGPNWLQTATDYIDLRLSGQLHPKIKI